MPRITFPILVLAALAALAFDGDRNGSQFHLQSARIYYPGEQGVSVGLSGTIRRRGTMAFSAYRILNPVDFFARLPNPHAPGSTAGSDVRPVDVRDAARFQHVASWGHKPVVGDRYWYTESVPVPLKQKGTYVVRATYDGHEATTVVVITELGLIVKQSRTDILAYLIDRRTGQHIPNAPITFSHPGGQPVVVRTGVDGVARTSTKQIRSDDITTGVVVSGSSNGSFVIADSYHYRWYGRGVQSGTMYLHTDRPVYRPRQTVYYRGIYRTLTDDGTYGLPARDTVSVAVIDPRGGTLVRDTSVMSDVGTFNDSLVLADEPPLGNYTITATSGGNSFTFTFSVEEYKKPEYDVKVTTDRTSYSRGDRINATVRADYYFGSPVTEARVEWQVLRAPYWRPWWKGTEWAYLYDEDQSEPKYGTQIVKTGTGEIGDDGTYAISFPTDRDDQADYTYTIRASVVDASRRSITSSTSSHVTRGEYYVSARPARYVYKPGEDVRTIVSITSFDGERPASAPFDVEIHRTWWDSKRRYELSDRRQESVFKRSGRSDNSGEGSVPFTVAAEGYYTVSVVAHDTKGNNVSTSTSFYVTDGANPWWWGSTTGDVQIIPDREVYHPGEIMTALVVLPAGNADALITAEGATVYHHAVQNLSDNTAIVRLRFDERFAPAMFLTVSAMNMEQFHTHSRRIAVAPVDNIVRIQVVGDKAIYRPGEGGTLTVRATDMSGHPVPHADVALGMVDEAIFAISPDKTPPIEQFFYGTRHNQVVTNTSLSFYFYDHGRPSLSRSRGAGAIASEMAMDDNASPPAAPDAGDLMAASRMDATTEAFAQTTIRSDFRDQMFWTPSIRTGSDGTATIAVRFPDNLTTWRITARAITNATSVGQTTATVVARKDLMVRMETPRFMTQGDSLLIATTVHNYTSGQAAVKLVFEANGAEAAARERSVTIPASGEQRIDWQVRAPRVGQAVLTIKALSARESDAMELTVPVLPRGIRTWANGVADISGASGQRELDLRIPTSSDPATRAMHVTIAPSAASSVLGSLDELIGYPYGCVEQTMSRFLPTVVVADALDRVNVPFDAEKKKELPKMAATGLKRLYQLQHEDGGWGWWEHDETNPYMTAYVVYGLTVAKGDGYAVAVDRYRRGLQCLVSLIAGGSGGTGRGGELTTVAYMLFVASHAQRTGTDASVVKRTRELADEDDINNYALALLATAAHLQGESALAERYADRLARAAQANGAFVSWPGRSWHYNWEDDEVETTAFAVRALLAIRGETDLVHKGIRFLLSQKKGSAWHNTRQTAMVAYAMVEYVLQTKELDPDYRVTVAVNGHEIGSRRITRAHLFQPEIRFDVPAQYLRDGSNRVTVVKNGTGKLYANARVDYFATGDVLNAADAGFAVGRSIQLLRRVTQRGSVWYETVPFTGTVRSGDELLVHVQVSPSRESEYVMVEDPIPAGCEVVADTRGYRIPGVSGYDGSVQAYRYGRRPWDWWYADRNVRDEKVAFFAPRMSRGSHEFSYIIRAQIPGHYSIMPTMASLMYYPEIHGNSDAQRMTIID